MSTPRNLDPAAAAEHTVRAVYSDLVRTLARAREADAGLTDEHIVEALERLRQRYSRPPE
jgi:hypothetical protein